MTGRGWGCGRQAIRDQRLSDLQVIESVQRHKHDFTSLEVTIAKKTVLIRSLQSLIEEFRQMTEEKWKWWKGTAGLRHVVTINVNQR